MDHDCITHQPLPEIFSREATQTLLWSRTQWLHPGRLYLSTGLHRPKANRFV